MAPLRQKWIPSTRLAPLFALLAMADERCMFRVKYDADVYEVEITPEIDLVSLATRFVRQFPSDAFLGNSCDASDDGSCAIASVREAAAAQRRRCAEEERARAAAAEAARPTRVALLLSGLVSNPVHGDFDARGDHYAHPCFEAVQRHLVDANPRATVDVFAWLWTAARGGDARENATVALLTALYKPKRARFAAGAEANNFLSKVRHAPARRARPEWSPPPRTASGVTDDAAGGASVLGAGRRVAQGQPARVRPAGGRGGGGRRRARGRRRWRRSGCGGGGGFGVRLGAVLPARRAAREGPRVRGARPGGHLPQ